MLKNKKTILVAVGIILLLVGGIFVFTGGKKTPAPKEQVAQPMDEGSILPTVDSSVSVDLTSTNGKKEVILALKNIPNGTQSVDYELAYQEKTKGLQGVIGTISLDGEKKYEKKITLGTCSSGKCVYHEVEGVIKVTLKFLINGQESIFEKEYDI